MADPADLVFVNGAVFCADAARRWAEAIAVGRGRIVAVGASSEISARIGPRTHVIDLGGRMLCPGFQDAHVHPATGGLKSLRCDLLEIDARDEGLRRIGDYAGSHPDEAWIRGGGWKYHWFDRGCPPAALLDELVPDRPAYLRVADGHSGWANSRAIRLAGVGAGIPDPPGGRIERNSDGSPQGTFHERAMDLVEEVLPVDSVADFQAGILAGQEYLFSFGVTAWQDAWVEAPVHEAYRSLAVDGLLRATVRGALWWDPALGLEQLDRLVEMRAGSTDRYAAGAVKLMLDGVCENFTAAMLEPYLDAEGRPTGGTGINMIDPTLLPGIVAEVMRHGFQPHFHAIGDAAVRAALDAVEYANGDVGRTDLRPHISHIQVVDPTDVPRFRRVGVVANAQPLWACLEPAMTDLTIPFLGPERSDHQYPFGDLLRAGAVLAMGSDWSVSTPDVMAQVHVATRRTVPGSGDEAFLPDQRITLADALAAFTAGSAYVNHLDSERGTIAAGRVADLVVLDRNPFEVEETAAVRVELTLVGGAPVYERAGS